MEKKRALKAGAFLLLLGAGLVGVYLLRPPCLILKLTGLSCAGCGTQRMIACLLRGDLAGAWGYNPFMLLCLPLSGAYLLWEVLRYARGKPPLYKKKGTQAAFLAVLLLGAAFMVFRNLT